MEIVKRISVDLNQKGSAPVVDASQGDNVRFLELELMQNDAPWVLPSFVSVLVRYAKPDGTGGVYDTLPDGACAWSIHENVIKIALTEQLCAVSGAVMMQIVVMQGEKQVSTFPIVLRVCNEIAGLEDSQDYRNLATWLEEYGQGGYAHVGDQENPHGVTAQQVGAYAIGDNTVGLLGYYYCAVDFANKTVTLSSEQGKAVAPEELSWAVGDVVSMVNGSKYEDCATITAINGNVLTLDSLPFDAIVEDAHPDVDDWSIYVSAKQDQGVVDFGKGAVAIGLSNKASNRCAVALGEGNQVTAQYGTGIGRKNRVHAYAGFASGYENVVHPGASYARASGMKSEVWGEVGVAEGHECKAKARGARAAGYKTVAGGEFSETAGWETETGADASYSFARGQKTIADAWYTFVTGIRTISSKLQGHFVTGRYNKVVSELFTIGCGTSEDNRQNALGVKLDGTTDVYGHKITNVADGTAAGDAVNKRQLDTKAPAGYGLGGDAKEFAWADVDNITANGWYLTNSASIEGADGISGWCYMFVECWNHASCTQTLHPSNLLNVSLKRSRNVDGWGEWEWENPPMIAGEEYRTTERYNGKPVYAKLCDFGELPVASIKYANFGGLPKAIVSAHGFTTAGKMLPWNLSSESIKLNVLIYATYHIQICVETNYDTGGETAFVIVKYTKD